MAETIIKGFSVPGSSNIYKFDIDNMTYLKEEGKITTLYKDRVQTQAIYPKTFSKVVFCDEKENQTLDIKLNNIDNNINTINTEINGLSKILTFNNISPILKESFIKDSSLENYPWRAEIPLSEEVTENYFPDVVFSIKTINLGIMASVAQSYNGGIYVYSSIQPPSNVEISTIVMLKQNNN